MTEIDYRTPAALYLGRDWANAVAQGARDFPSVAHALQFALEEAAPVSLHGAMLVVGGRTFSATDMKRFHGAAAYPLRRKPQPQRLAA